MLRFVATAISLLFIQYSVNAVFIGLRHSQFGFIENKGQIVDQSNQSNPSVLYLYNGENFHVQLHRNGFSYEVIQTKEEQEGGSSSIPGSINRCSLYVHRVDIHFEGSNPDPEILAIEPFADYLNYYTSVVYSDAAFNVRHYRKIMYKNIYPNIDIEFAVKDLKEFKYNIIVRPGGNPDAVKMAFEGAIRANITKAGCIYIETAYGAIEESIPYSYQLASNGQAVKKNVKFCDRGQNTFGLKVSEYNTLQTLIIDPMPWASYCGGSGNENGNDLARDRFNNLVITGYTNSSTSFASSGSYQSVYGGNTSDAFVSKFNVNGNRQWTTYCGGTGIENGRSVAIDTNENIVVTGETTSDTVMASSGSYQVQRAGATDAFIIKLSPLGMRLWATYFGGSGDENALGVAVQASGDIAIIGYSGSSSGIATTGAFQTSLTGTLDAFIVKFNAAGNRLWSTYYGGVGIEIGNGIAFDLSANILVTGQTSSTSNMSTTGAHQSTYGGGYWDAFIAKFNTTGNRLWSTYYGGNSVDVGKDITCDGWNNVCVTGWTQSSSGIASSLSITDMDTTSFNAFQSSYNGGSTAFGDAFVVKLNSGGTLIWGTYYGGYYDDNGFGITTDAYQNILFIGFTQSNSDIATSNAHQTTYAGGTDAFFVKFTPTGVRLYATYYGGSASEWGNGISANDSNIFICGSTASNSGIATSGSFQSSKSGNFDAYIATFTSGGVLPVVLLHMSARTENGYAHIFWSTLTEVNTERFEVEKLVCSSATSAVENFDWKKIGTLRAAGNSATIQNYVLTDTISLSLLPFGSVLFYRLRIIDFDGKAEVSKPAKLQNYQDELNEFSVYPNPTQNQLNFTILNPGFISIISMNGNFVFQQNFEPGNHTISCGHFSKGIYIIKYINNLNTKFTSLFIKD